MSSVTLGWNSDADAVNGYNVYRGSTSGGEATLLNSSPVVTTSVTDSSPLIGANYYVIKAIGYGGTLSTVSNEVVYIPSPISASLLGSGSVAATSSLSAVLVGTGLVAAALAVPLTAALGGTGSLTATLVQSITASLAGTGSIAASIVNPSIVSALIGAGSVTANLVNQGVVAILAGGGMLYGVLSSPAAPTRPPTTGLAIFTTTYLRNLLATNPTTQVFPVSYIQTNGRIAGSVTRAQLQTELNTRVAIQDEIWGLSFLPQNPT